jgi:tetratricopeptide (TPR) repeat protein
LKNAKAQQLLAQAFQLLSAGQLREAQRACRKAVQARPDLPEVHLLLSEIHHQGGDAARAREAAERALRLRPGWSEAFFALGNVEALAGNLPAAEAQFRASIAAGSPGAGVHANLGNVLMRQGRLPEAREAYERALSHDPGVLELQLNVAMILGELGQGAAAVERLLALVERYPDSAQARFALGNALAATGRREDAISVLGELLKRQPSAIEAREQLLRLLHGSQRFAEMEAVAREGRSVSPAHPVFAHQLGVAVWWQERYEDALTAFDDAERIAQDRTSAAYREAKVDQATSLLALGRWREGWQAYQWRPTRTTWRTRFPKVSEDPAAIAALRNPASILILGEQGLGDDLFFLRFAGGLRSRGHRLRGAFDPRLTAILALIPGLFEELSGSFDAAPEADLNILSGDLPLATAQDFAPPVALPVDSDRRARFEKILRDFGPPPYIGVTWRAGALPEDRKQQGMFYLVKQVPPDELGAALRPLRATFCVVQRKPTAEDQQRFVAALGRPALDLSAMNDDLRDALALLSVLDDYVGVSNTNTHLRAGCPGKVARVLVPSNPEWRWGMNGTRSPWFPAFSVYRQDRRYGWAPALSALQRELSHVVVA